MPEVARVDFSRIAQDLQLRRVQVESVVALLDEGNTVPFITRYRKERTGNLDEETIRRIQERVRTLRLLADRKTTVLRSIESQGKLSDELRAAIEAAESFKRLEDLYLPFKPKKRTLATQAREKGLEPLASAIWCDAESARDLAAAAQALLDPAKGLNTAEDVLSGVGHIIAETIAENAAARAAVRRIVWQSGKLVSSKAENLPDDKGRAYRDYFEYSEPAAKIPPHRVLALNRGEREEAIRIRLDLDDEAARQAVFSVLPPDGHTHTERLRGWAADALTRLILPSLEREVRRELTDEAEEHAVKVFARNLRSLLLQPPVRGKRVLGIDPGYRTGCKVAVIDEIGNPTAHAVIWPHPPQSQRGEAKETVVKLAHEHTIQVIAIGNGTGCRETEELVAEVIAESLPELAYTIVNEAGASVYSTSAVGREEFPDQDATLRGTISIARRLQDPLSELVKIESQHIGVGMYQHDVHPRRLKESLGTVVESCVNFVGVHLNTASVPLLRYVSGLNQLTARRLVEWRQANGPFQRREQIREVPGIGDAVYTQAAGFLQILEGANPLDATWIHPESYAVAEKLLARLELDPAVLNQREKATLVRDKLEAEDREALARELEVGVETMRDIIEALQRPGRDPREDLPPPIFKKGVLKLEDLQPGMELHGTVLNVVDFGAFVDIGLKDSGLVHISQLSTRYIRSPHDVVSVGQVVTAWVMSVDAERRRVSLTMIQPGTERKPQRAPRPAKPAAAPPPAAAAPQASAGPPAPASRAVPPRPHPPRPARKPRPPSKPLPASVLAGTEPARSFGELKRLWDATRKR